MAAEILLKYFTRIGVFKKNSAKVLRRCEGEIIHVFLNFSPCGKQSRAMRIY